MRSSTLFVKYMDQRKSSSGEQQAIGQLTRNTDGPAVVVVGFFFFLIMLNSNGKFAKPSGHFNNNEMFTYVS